MVGGCKSVQAEMNVRNCVTAVKYISYVTEPLLLIGGLRENKLDRKWQVSHLMSYFSGDRHFEVHM